MSEQFSPENSISKVGLVASCYDHAEKVLLQLFK